MKKINLLFISMGLMFSILSCNKEPISGPSSEDVSYYEEKEIEVEIASPYDGQSFNYNEEIEIKGIVSANFLLHGFQVKVFNQTNNDSLMHDYYVHDHSEALDFSKTWINKLPQDSQVRIEVSGFGNHYLGALIETHTVLINCYSP